MIQVICGFILGYAACKACEVYRKLKLYYQLKEAIEKARREEHGNR